MKRKIDVMDLITYTLLVVFTIACIYPVWYVLAASFSNGTELAKHPGFLLWPKNFTTGAYSMVFQNPLIMNGLKNSIKILLYGLPINMVMTK